MVLVVLADRTNARSDGWCWPSLPAIAADAGIGVRTARRAIRRISESKLVEIEERSGKTSRYRVLLPNDDYPSRARSRPTPVNLAGATSVKLTPANLTPRASATPTPANRGQGYPGQQGTDEPEAAGREPEAAARALKLALAETDRRRAAGEPIRNRRKYAEAIASDFMAQAELEVAHAGCPVCGGAGTLEGYSPGCGTYRTPCPGVEQCR
jgi:hypothetical protein